MNTRKMVALALFASAAALPLPLLVAAEPLSMRSPPTPPRDESAPPDPIVRDLYPQRSPAAQDPHFVGPLSKETSNGRLGVAGWTSQPVPTGSRVATDPDNSGWLGAGFAMEWGRAPKHRQNN